MPTVEEVQGEVVKAVAAVDETMKGISAQLKRHETLIDEMVKRGDRPEADKAHIETMKKLEGSLDTNQSALAAMQAELVTLKAESVARLDELQKALQRGGLGEGGVEMPKLAGDAVLEAIKGEERMFKDFMEGKRNDPSLLPSIKIPGGTFAEQPVFKGYDAETVKALTSTPPTNLIAPYQISGYMPLLRRQLLIRDLIPVVQAPMAQVIRYIRQTAFSSSAAATAVAIVQMAGVATVTQAGHGFEEYDRIRIAGATQAGYNLDTYIKVVDADHYTYPVLAGTATPATGAPTAFRLNNFGAPTWVSETDSAPESAMFFEERTANIATVDFALKVGRNILDDLPGLKQGIDNDGIFGLRLAEDRAILYATGTGIQMAGLLTDPARQQVKWSQMHAGDTKAKAIRRSRTLIELANGQASGCILHPLVWEEIELETGTQGQYIWVPSAQSSNGLNPTGQDFWRVPLVVTPAVAASTWVIADFARVSTLYDRLAAQVLWTNSNEDDFKKRLLCALFEERIGQAVKRPELLVQGTWDAQP